MRKLKYLDGLRGIVALMVVFHHYILAFYPALFFGNHAKSHLENGLDIFISGSPLNLFYNGNFAVCIFFVLSGFVLSYKFFAAGQSEILVAGAIKRYFRLVLPMSFSIMAGFFLMKTGLFFNQQVPAIVGSSWLGDFWKFSPNFIEALRQSFLGIFFTNDFSYNVVLWTIPYEFLGSLLVFAALALFGKSRNRYVFYFVAILFFLQTYYLAFIFGIILSDIVSNEKTFLRKLDKLKILRVVFLIGALFLASFPSGREIDGTIYAFLYNKYISNLPMFYHIIGSCMFMLVLLDSKKMEKFFSNKVFLFLGGISFSMYLIHLLILGSFSSFLFIKLAPHIQYHYATTLTVVLSIPVIVLASYLVHEHIDKRVSNFSYFVYQNFFKAN